MKTFHSELRRGLSVAFAAILAGTVCLTTDAAGADKVNVGKAVPFAWTFTPVEIGIETGIWAKHGIEPVATGFGGDAKVQQALVAGSIDFGLGSGPGLAFMGKGVPAKGVAAFAGKPHNIGLVVPYDSLLKKPSDLKGKKIGVTTAGSLTDWLVKRVSRAEGWGTDGITTVPLGGLESSRAALRTGQVDGLALAVEVAYALELRKEAKAIFTFAGFVDDFHTHVVFARNELIDKKPDLVLRFLKGWFETIAFMKANKKRTVEMTARILKSPEEVMSRTYDEEIGMFSDDGRFSPRAVEVLKDSFIDMGILKERPSSELLFTTQFVPVKF